MNAKTGISQEVKLPTSLEHLRVLGQNHLMAREISDAFYIVERQGNEFVISDTLNDGRSPSV